MNKVRGEKEALEYDIEQTRFALRHTSKQLEDAQVALTRYHQELNIVRGQWATAEIENRNLKVAFDEVVKIANEHKSHKIFYGVGFWILAFCVLVLSVVLEGSVF